MVTTPETIVDLFESNFLDPHRSQALEQQIRIDVKTRVSQHVQEWQEFVPNPARILGCNHSEVDVGFRHSRTSGIQAGKDFHHVFKLVVHGYAQDVLFANLTNPIQPSIDFHRVHTVTQSLNFNVFGEIDEYLLVVFTTRDIKH